MEHPETLPPETLRQMGIKELRERAEYLKKRVKTFSMYISSSKHDFASLPAQIEELERRPIPLNALEVYGLAARKSILENVSKLYPERIAHLQTAEDELAAVHRELEWRQAERHLAQRGELGMWLWILNIHHTMLCYAFEPS